MPNGPTFPSKVQRIAPGFRKKSGMMFCIVQFCDTVPFSALPQQSRAVHIATRYDRRRHRFIPRQRRRSRLASGPWQDNFAAYVRLVFGPPLQHRWRLARVWQQPDQTRRPVDPEKECPAFDILSGGGRRLL
jgi:hypothetical protein